jgi:hypothetical protein
MKEPVSQTPANEKNMPTITGFMALALHLLAIVAMVLMPIVTPVDANAQVTLQDLIKPQQTPQIDPNVLQIQPKLNPQVLCLPPFINKNNQCVCPVGQVKEGNTCKPIVLQILCQAPFVPKNGQCVCPAGQTKVGNTCKPLVVPILCLAPFVPKNGQCVCPAGQTKVGNTCKPLQILCLAPFVPKNGQCVCPAGQTKVGNTCKPLQILCLAPFVPKNGQCVCPDGQQKVGNTCKQIVVPIVCNAPFVPSNGQCVCPDGKFKVGNTCQTPQVQCDAPFVPGSNGTCTCPSGTQFINGTCLAVNDAPQCNFPFVLNKSQTSCVCASGYGLNASGTQCIRKQTQQVPSVSKQLIAEIQRCLNKIGYDAGPVDGDIGSRTRSAWSAFRDDQGLLIRPNTFSDAVTQDRLFQACAKPVGVAPQPEPEPEPEPQDTGMLSPATNFDPETGYPAIQCVSQNLADLISPALGEDEALGICGIACIPIPDGMTPDQIEATKDNVNWCLNCTKVGESGLICAAPPMAEENAN